MIPAEARKSRSRSSARDTNLTKAHQLDSNIEYVHACIIYDDSTLNTRVLDQIPGSYKLSILV